MDVVLCRNRCQGLGGSKPSLLACMVMILKYHDVSDFIVVVVRFFIPLSDFIVVLLFVLFFIPL